ncbi:MAG TPA: ABC transporter ATP-binding protein [Spirochaetota bacterium]|jgi:ABC-type lipoprotein export system ATPase subunit|nr:ABC transporter ATP-binding protein [Spirochaetota bacterium]HOR43384.1 ABC transporter ATP-binding protein [Spirochaetota bacterium]HPK54867.1 ABC transporter ATP-binding protein [Spirochaetota bacterium]
MLLSVENINLKFGKRIILNNVSFKADTGKIIAITGKSGCGKTTLLGIVSGLLNPDSGKVFYNNKNILRWGDFRKSHFRNKEIGFVFQFFNLMPDMSSYQNIIFPALIRLFPRNVKKELNSLVEYLNIKDIINHYPTTLSGGERQRVAIARAIINKPKMILADEPTGNLDNTTAEDIKNLFIKLKKEENMSLIIVTHDKRLVEIADEHLHLENGILKKQSKQKDTKKIKAVKTVKKK